MGSAPDRGARPTLLESRAEHAVVRPGDDAHEPLEGELEFVEHLRELGEEDVQVCDVVAMLGDDECARLLEASAINDEPEVDLGAVTTVGAAMRAAAVPDDEGLLEGRNGQQTEGQLLDQLPRVSDEADHELALHESAAELELVAGQPNEEVLVAVTTTFLAAQDEARAQGVHPKLFAGHLGAARVEHVAVVIGEVGVLARLHHLQKHDRLRQAQLIAADDTRGLPAIAEPDEVVPQEPLVGRERHVELLQVARASRHGEQQGVDARHAVAREHLHDGPQVPKRLVHCCLTRSVGIIVCLWHSFS